MSIITVKNSKTYNVHIETGLFKCCGDLIKKACGGEKILIVSDDNVYPIYGKVLTDILEKAGYKVCSFVIEHGEKSKNITNLAGILSYLAQNEFTRSDCLCTLGGGVVGDLGALAAGMFNRGIKLAAIPTSLLAMVDSSVGGKTAIDLPEGKNLAGMFYQPDIVICDPAMLRTLPYEFMKDGFAEVIKYGVIKSESLFKKLNDVDLKTFADEKEKAEDIISECVAIKRDVVGEDEFDNGLRQILNFGHTIAHCIELLSNYEIPHGTAVSIGMVSITKASAQKDICPESCYADLLKLTEKHGMATLLPFEKSEIFNAALHDKKRKGNSITLVLPLGIGECELRKIPVEEITEYIGE
ncbi:MAG: 3-dehydroquinate synthase [Ruminococcaceae bacterium]|nr:3-dehydroquinate synthase [Oscillospiraceae bacterium]